MSIYQPEGPTSGLAPFARLGDSIMPTRDHLMTQQIEYYRARAGEYDEWFLRKGRYDRGDEFNRRWFAESESLTRAIEEFSPRGRVLELACGTGLFTQHLVRHADSITAVDASAEAIDLNRRRCGESRIRYVQDDLFEWTPDGPYDAVFFSFWLSHVPPGRFAEFWQKVRASLIAGGRVLIIDSLYNPESTARDHRLHSRETVTSVRRLNDGREFEIYKVFYEPENLRARLDDMGWRATVDTTGEFFLYGIAENPAPGVP